MTKITTELVQALFDYKDGALYWRQSPSRNTSAGMRAGCHHGTRYVNVSIKNRLHTEHRLVWLWHGNDPCDLLDHINGDKHDNRIENLRAATPSQNQHNRQAQKNSSLGVKGVFCEGTRYTAQIQVNGKRKRLGSYPTIEEAAAARRQAESLLFSTELLPC
jgi:hypothetical protein